MTYHGLSSREVEIIDLAAEGITDKEIAARLGLSLGTVSTYWARCRTKLGVGTRAACVALLIGSRQESVTSAEPLFEARWNALMEATDDAVAVVSARGRVAHASRTFLDVVGSTLSELRRPGSRLDDRLSCIGDEAESLFSSNGPMLRAPHMLELPDASTITVFLSIHPIDAGTPHEQDEVLLRLELN